MSSTNGVNTGDWLEASKALHVSAYMPGSPLPVSVSTTVRAGGMPRQRRSNTLLKKSSYRIREQEFEQQKAAFKSIAPALLEPHQGQFVASVNGHIVDNDDDLAALTGRFFREHGDVPVYIAKVGEPIQVTIHTPLGE